VRACNDVRYHLLWYVTVKLFGLCLYFFAGENASFGQPEVKLGTIPGAGGTQRMARAMGKGKVRILLQYASSLQDQFQAMHMILTGESISAKDAEKAGLVAKIYPDDQVLTKAIEHGKSKVNRLSLR
jgi:enoyl-CoA hydratase/carnithine racemase